MENFEDKLNRHIDKVLEIQQNRESKPLTLDELKEVDLSLGMTEEEWEALLKRADENAALAQSHMSYGNYAEAYKTADQAIAINPYQESALIVLANASIGIYENDDKEEYLEKAKLYANELLKINPNERQAIEILSKVGKYQKSEIKEKKNFLRYILIGVGVIAAVALFFVLKPTAKPIENTALKFELIEAEENANAAWAQVENVISRRDQMLPQILELVPGTNSEAGSISSDIEALSRQIVQSVDANEKVALQGEMQDKIKDLISLLNKSETDEKVKLILVQIEGSYNRIAVEGKRYNETVKIYNILVKKHGGEFPDFKEKAYFKGR